MLQFRTLLKIIIFLTRMVISSLEARIGEEGEIGLDQIRVSVASMLCVLCAPCLPEHVSQCL